MIKKLAFAPLLLLLLILLLGFRAKTSYPQDYFRPPLNIPLVLSGSFCELRSNHFHSGIDIKTKGVEGYRVYAAAEGYVSRIKVKPGGFGKAVYIRHPNGYTTVYAHLSTFNDKIEAYVKKKQYAQESFGVDLYPDASMFRVEKGEKIALSGNSGSSGGPHLHFEVRETATEHPVNPLLFGFDVKDTQAPDIHKLAIYAMEKGSAPLPTPDIYKVSGSGPQHSINEGIVMVPSDFMGVGINAHDTFDGASNHNGEFSVELNVDDQTVFFFERDELSFSFSRYINSYIDYAYKAASRLRGNTTTIQKFFTDPGNKFPFFDIEVNEGLVDLSDGEVHDIVIRVRDQKGNLAKLAFKAQKSDGSPAKPDKYFQKRFDYNQAGSHTADGFRIDIPQGALYRDLDFEYDAQYPGDADIYSKVHQVHNGMVPLHKHFVLKIEAENLPAALNSKAIIAYKDYRGRESALSSSSWDGNFMRVKNREFGKYYITIDDTPPKITPVNISDGKNMSSNSSIQVKISDDLSGIDKFRATVDGQWILMEYDPKRSRLTHHFDGRVSKGSHTFKLTVKDGRANKSTYTANFTK